MNEPPRPSARPPAAASPAQRTVRVEGVTVGRGSRVRLRPSRTADILDMALAGRLAEVDAVEENFEGEVHLAVVLEDDPGRDLGTSGKIGHRFFFTPDEVEPVGGVASEEAPRPRVLVAGIGNVFLADDGFGPGVVDALRAHPLPAGVHVADFGIRGMDLAYRLLDGYEAVLLIDAAPRGERPGTLSVIEAALPPERVGLPETHAMDPVKVLALARWLGEGELPRVLVLACEPEVVMTGAEPDVVVGLSAPVQDAVARAVPLVGSVVAELLGDAEPPSAVAHGGHHEKR